MKNLIFTPQELKLIQKKPLPEHVAIIMDGNRRWAKERISKLVNVCEGHYAGANIIQNIVRASQEIGIKTLTIWALSTENWRRPKTELQMLIALIQTYLRDHLSKMIENGIKFSIIGNPSPFPESLQNELVHAVEMTKEGKKIELILALNYGGRDDIKRAVQKIMKEKKWKPDDITEDLISSYLDTSSWKDPDLLIRTSNEMRVSNFLLWQIAYTEIYVSEKLWPDFTPLDLLNAVLRYQMRERRRGE